MAPVVSKNPLVSVIVPVHNGANVLERCLDGVMASDYPNVECLVVDDGSTDDSRAIASRFPVRIVRLEGAARGPASARNRAAHEAQGDVLFFVDADVVLHPGALSEAVATLDRHSDVDAVFGMYDERPEARDFVSQYRNLLHHFVHQSGREESATFWSGCGAVRRDAFLSVGGFDEDRYPRPSIEDIDLGVRLRVAGHRILLNKSIQARHLKRWTLRGMILADIFDRGIPWTLLILRQKRLPNDLNLGFSHRVSALFVYGILLTLGVAAFFHNVVLLLLLDALFLLGVGRWCWPGRVAPAISRHAELLTYALLAVTVLVSVATGRANVLPLISPVLLANVAGGSPPRLRVLWGQTFFGVEVFGLTLAFVLELAQFPPWIALFLVLDLGLIVILNYQLYAFFARERGFAFALAVVPYHLLYYFYSVLAFGLGIALHVLANRRSPGIIGPSGSAA